MISASAFFSASSSAGWMPRRAQRLHLTLFELRLREDVAVHLHEHLLDDLRRDWGGRPRPSGTRAGQGWRAGRISEASGPSILCDSIFYLQPSRSLNNPPTRVKTPEAAARVLRIGLSEFPPSRTLPSPRPPSRGSSTRRRGQPSRSRLPGAGGAGDRWKTRVFARCSPTAAGLPPSGRRPSERIGCGFRDSGACRRSSRTPEGGTRVTLGAPLDELHRAWPDRAWSGGGSGRPPSRPPGRWPRCPDDPPSHGCGRSRPD